MNIEKLKPKDISDIIFKVDEYLDYMRANRQDASELINLLDNYIKEYFESATINDIDLKTLTVKIVDEMYLNICRLASRDIHTDGYFGIIVNRLFFELARKNILCFFIIDNSLRDDRFKLVVELFGVSHFKTVFPYVTGQLNYSDNFTKFPTKDFKLVEKEFDETSSLNRHLLYLEKDDSVNYLSKVLSIAEEFQSKYICVFRNQSPDSGKPATWLLGSFSEILN